MFKNLKKMEMLKMAVANTSKLNKVKKSFIRFFKEIRLELKKVIWPSRKQLINNTATVLASCLIVGVLLWVIDLGLGQLTQWFFSR